MHYTITCTHTHTHTNTQLPCTKYPYKRFAQMLLCVGWGTAQNTLVHEMEKQPLAGIHNSAVNGVYKQYRVPINPFVPEFIIPAEPLNAR